MRLLGLAAGALHVCSPASVVVLPGDYVVMSIVMSFARFLGWGVVAD